MKFWLKRSGSSDFVGPLTKSEIQQKIRTGSFSWDDQALEATGQSLGALKRSTDWVKLSVICPPGTLPTTQSPETSSMRTHASLEYLGHVRRNTCYSALRSMVELFATLAIIVVVFVSGLYIVLGLLSHTVVSVIIGFVAGALGCLTAIATKHALFLMVDIADILIHQSKEKKETE